MLEISKKIIGEGNQNGEIEWWQFVIRAVVVFIVTLTIIRFGGKRMFGKQTAFDIVTSIILGSILSRAITGNAPFYSTILAAVTFVAIHRLFAFFAFRSDWFGSIIKGNARILVKDGDIDWDAMARSQISKKDLLEAVRQNSNNDDLEKIKTAYLERSGDISVIKEENNKEEDGDKNNMVFK